MLLVGQVDMLLVEIAFPVANGSLSHRPHRKAAAYNLLFSADLCFPTARRHEASLADDLRESRDNQPQPCLPGEISIE
jgi:hypothetical protein